MNKEELQLKILKLYEQLKIATKDFDYFLIQADIDYYEGLLMKIGEND